MKLWVVVANSSYAEIFATEHNGRDFHKVQQIDFPEGRKKSGSMLSDRPGRGFEGAKNSPGAKFGRHAYSSEVDIHMHEQQVFAHKIADVLRKGRADNAFERLALIAPPQFLGELRIALTDAVRKVLFKEINKDIPSSHNERERIEEICRLLEMQKPVPSL